MIRPVYRFATFRLDVAARELEADGAIVNVSPKVFDGLVWLIEHRDRAVGRDELIAAVWGRADVTDAQLGQLMRKLRRTIGDEGEAQAFVRTVPRFGYRWVAPTQVDDAADTAAALAPEVPVPARAPSRRRPARLAAAGIAALAAAAAFAAWWLRAPPSDGTSDVVAVLPVATGTEPESAWLRLGLMDRIADDLRAAGLRVVPSDNIAAAARNDRVALLDDDRVGAATGARRFVAATTRRVANGWVSRIEWREGGHVRREVEANGDGAIAATREASRRLLAAIGRAPADNGAEHRDASAAQWLDRIDAATLDRDYAQARELLDAAPAPLRDGVPWLLRRADVDLATQRMTAAKQGYLEILDRAATQDVDATTRARALIGVSGPIAQEGDLAGATARLDAAIALLGGLNAPQWLGEALYGRGIFAMVQGDLDRADADYSQARIAFELAGASLQLARLHGQQATLLAIRARHAEALAMWSEAADRFERFGDADALVDALGNAATEQLSLLLPQAAQASIDRAEPWLARLDQPLTDALFRYAAARVAAQNGRLQTARTLLDALAGDAASAQVAGMDATIRIELAHLTFAAGDATGAAARAVAAMTRLREPDLASPVYARIRNDATLLWIRALRASGDAAAADAETRRFVAQPPGDGATSIYARLADAESQWSSDNLAARRAYDAALSVARRNGAPADIAEVVVSYGQSLLAAGDIAQATAVAGQVSQWAGRDYACAVLQARLYLALRQPEAFAQAIAGVRTLAGERPLPRDLVAAARELR